ncbi:MAG: hypothetical protein K2K14_06745, partial [Ruminococcus sp.]|nr:hypothetical protein [Ruminococcus sp.]
MKLINKMKENYSSEVMLLSVVCFLAGVVVGILLAPVKKGFMLGCYNGINYMAYTYKSCNMNSDEEEDLYKSKGVNYN